jgi:hypothetical protein
LSQDRHEWVTEALSIDRSTKMIDMATRRNRAHVDSGRAPGGSLNARPS